MIHLLFTGGTISMRRDEAAGGNVPAHAGEKLVELAPELQRIAPYRIENWAKIPACHMGPDKLWALRERFRHVVESGEVTGLVITMAPIRSKRPAICSTGRSIRRFRS